MQCLSLLISPSSEWALWVSARWAVSSAAHEGRERGEGRKKKKQRKCKKVANSTVYMGGVEEGRKKGRVKQRGRENIEMSQAGCCFWLSFIRALHLRFHVTNVCSVCSAVLFCISRNKSAVSIWVTLYTGTVATDRPWTFVIITYGSHQTPHTKSLFCFPCFLRERGRES